MSRVSLSLLGPMRLRRPPGEAAEPPRGKTAALLAYLALRPGRPHARDILATLLWGDSGDERARHSLRQALTAVRQAIAGGRRPVLLVDGETVALNPAAVDVDVVAFEGLATATSPRALERAARLYRGDFLEGVTVKEAAFEEWLRAERERLRELAGVVLTRLLAHQTNAWLDDSAIQTAGRLLALDPLREAAHRTLMRVYGRQGRREAALRQYRECVVTLNNELGVEPEPETVRLYQQLVQQPADRDRALDATSAPSPRLRQCRTKSRQATADTALGKRQQVTVLYADVDGPLLETTLVHLTEAVHHYEGTVNRVTRAGILALFGAPFAQEDHAVRACQAALRMQDAVTTHTGQIRCTLRVGLNSGEVEVLSIGPDLRDYTPVDQIARLATRLKQLAPPGAIRITAATRRLADGFAQVRPVGPATATWLAAPVEVYELVGAHQTGMRVRIAGRRLSRFVGRDTEMEQLGVALDRARGKHGEIVAVVGEPGVGKSRLVLEFSRCPRVAGCLALQANAVSHGRTVSYSPIVGFLKVRLGIDGRDDAASVRAKVTRYLGAPMPSFAELGPPILWVLDALPEDDDFRRLEPLQRRRRTVEALKRVLLREGEVQPLLLVFEDLQWIDGETQAVLDSLVESLPTVAVLLVVTYRPEYLHGWGGKTYYRQLRVDPLPPPSAAALLDALVGHAHDLGPLKRWLTEMTEGNPLFLEEGVRALVETGTLMGKPGAYEPARRVERLEIPPTVHAILAARIDRLTPDDKRLLQAASVIGKDVPRSLLAAIADAPEDALNAGLGRLRAAEFLYETRLSPEVEYTFKHALTHEVTYASLLVDRRRALHARIMDAIERLHTGRLEEQIERLAHHAMRGEVWDKARLHCRRAGAKAMERSALREAVTAFEQALAALGRLPDSRATREQAIDLRFDVRNALVPLGEHGRILEHLRQAETLAEALDDRPRLGRVAAYMAASLWQLGDPERGLASGRSALAIATALEEVGLQVAAQGIMGELYLWGLSDYRRAAECFRRNVEIAPSRSRPEHVAVAAVPSVANRANLAWCLAELGVFAEGRAYGEDALRLAEVVDHRYSLARTCAAVGHAFLCQGDLLQTVRFLERALALSEAMNFLTTIRLCTGRLGVAYALAGRIPEAQLQLERTREHLDATTQTILYPLYALPLAEGYLLVGCMTEALSFAARALEIAQTHQGRGYQADALRLLGEIAAQHEPPDVAQADTHYRQASALAEELGMRPLVAHCHLGLGRLQRRTGRREQAEDHLTAAMAMYREMDMSFWLEKTQAEMQ